jgi:ketosteroid isomerase-like protein
MTQIDIIKEYYRCFSEKDKAPLYQILSPDFKHISPFAEYNDRDKMIEEIWPYVGQAIPTNLEIFISERGYMVKFKNVGAFEKSMAEYIEFNGNRIAKIEVFAGK